MVLANHERGQIAHGNGSQRQNEALMSKLILGVCVEAGKIWSLAHLEVKRSEMEDSVCFTLIAFGTGLRGEEVPLVSLEGLLNIWMEMQTGNTNERHMMMMLSGQFKGEVDSRWHMVPICDKTRSNIAFHLRMERIMRQRVNLSTPHQGVAFQD